jgi:transcription elongation factor GreB
VSRAFVKEDQPEAPVVAPPRAALPEGTPNYVTARGLELLREELTALERERVELERTPADDARARALALWVRRKGLLEERIATAQLVEPPERREEVRFGASVTLRAGDGSERSYRIVGVDEAEPRAGSIAFVSPLARALLGKRLDDVATVRTPRGDEELEIVKVEYV